MTKLHVCNVTGKLTSYRKLTSFRKLTSYRKLSGY